MITYIIFTADSDRERSALIQFKINKYKDHEKLLHSIISNDICEQKNVSNIYV